MKITEYIEKEKLKEALCPYSDTNYAQDMETILRIVDEFPAADVAPVKHGKWFDKGSLSCRCSNCGCKSPKEYDFCPNCGVKMDFEKESEEK